MKYSKEDVLKAVPVLLPDYKGVFDVDISEDLNAETSEEKYYYTIHKKGQKKPIGTFFNSHICKALKSLAKTYGYCRISRPQQSIDRQIRNIKAEYPAAIIIKEAYTGTKMNRPEWNKLYKNIKPGERIVFDSVSRMSRNADEGIETYFELYEKGIELVFLKEHYIDSAVYAENMRDKIELIGTDEDEIFKGLNNYFRKLAAKQIRIAFNQAEKEVNDLHQRTREGIETARLNGKQIGRTKGKKVETPKAKKAKRIIKEHSQSFNGTLSDPDVIKLAGCSRNSFYKYKAELRNENI